VNFVVNTFALLVHIVGYLGAGRMVARWITFAVEHRVCDDIRTPPPSWCPCPTIAVQESQWHCSQRPTSLRTSAVPSPVSCHGAETPEAYGEAMADADSGAQLRSSA
jgi:hypothetical protein